MRYFLRAAVAAAVVCLSAWPSAQSRDQPPPPPQQPPTFRTEANFVRVDAYPSKDGKPVLDLAAGDFEIFEDGAPQKVDSFEHVVVRPAGPQSERVEPSSQREMLQAAENPRHRVFVIFLDGPHVDVAGSHDIAGPLIRLINRILGPDDLVGVMTPEMAASDVVLARRTEVTEEQLRKHWTWGRRFSVRRDDRERDYADCYGPAGSEIGGGPESALAKQLIARKRERVTLEALEDLVRYLSAIREERKAILTVTEGWVLYRPDDSLLKLRSDPLTGQSDSIPSVDPVGIGPDGKLTTKDPRRYIASSKMDCDADRMRLAAMDDEDFLRNIIAQANRGNASFYPIDPRGLPAFDTPIGPEPPLGLAADARSLRTRREAMRTLASGTDGVAAMDSNDLDQGMKRISDDLTSYYLLGYYSTNAKLDGGYRSLKVRVKRPGVDVRARRGYRAATTEEVSRARSAAAAPDADLTLPLRAATDMLARLRPDARLRLHATTAPGGTLWVAGELSPGAGRADEWGAGATADLQIVTEGTTTTARLAVKPGDRTFLTSVKLPPGAASGIEVRARAAAADGDAPPALESLRVSSSVQPLFYRRGPATANRQVPTADLRFTRAERAHLELPASAGARPGAGRLLDRSGQPLPVPVAVAERTDAASGQRWITADVALAPLAPGDYAVEMASTENGVESRVVAGIRVVR